MKLNNSKNIKEAKKDKKSEIDISDLSIKEVHGLLITKRLTCVELVEICIRNSEKYDPTLKVFITTCFDSALQEAREVDEKINKGEEIGVLEGIPYTAKDVILTKGTKTTAGSKMLENFNAPYDATVIERLTKAGAILIGKTNCDAYGHGGSTENSDFFVTRNPYDTTRVSGGSSGGSAVATRLEMGLFSLGEDTGGSIRQPAAFCNVLGLKTSYGRVSRYGSIAYASSLDTIGIFGNNAGDISLVLKAIGGHDKKDHTTYQFKEDEKISKNNEANKVIGIPKEYFTKDLDQRIKKNIEKAVLVYKNAGYKIQEISLPHTDISLAAYYILAPAETSTNLNRLDGIRFGHRTDEFKGLESLYKKSRSEGFGDEVKRRIMVGTYALSSGYYDAYFKKAAQVRTLICRDFKNALEEVDYILSPTSPSVAWRVGEKIDPVSAYLADIYTIAFSLAGLPTISIPCGFVDRMPVGMQLTANILEEEKILKLAALYQNETNFHKVKTDLN